MGKVLQVLVLGLLSTVAFSLPVERNVGEYGDFVEGDMRLTDEQMEDLFSPARNGLIKTKYRWPNKTVPYELNINHSQEQNDLIELALKTIESVSCVRFIKRTTETDYIDIMAEESGCHSQVGFTYLNQIVNLKRSSIGQGCFRLGTIMHEFLHALGFYHMQSAYDRDDYVKIHWENIPVGVQNNFMKYTDKWVTHFNTTYDYESVMHYEAYAFSKNGQATIVPVDKKYLGLIGQRERLSEKDIFKLNAMYECNGTTNEQ